MRQYIPWRGGWGGRALRFHIFQAADIVGKSVVEHPAELPAVPDMGELAGEFCGKLLCIKAVQRVFTVGKAELAKQRDGERVRADWGRGDGFVENQRREKLGKRALVTGLQRLPQFRPATLNERFNGRGGAVERFGVDDAVDTEHDAAADGLDGILGCARQIRK